MTKFKVGESVWAASFGSKTVRKPCDTCFGKKEVTLILGNCEQVVLACQACGNNNWGIPLGYHEETEYIAEAELISIDKISVTFTDSGEIAEYETHTGIHGCSIYKECDLFTDEASAIKRAQEKKAIFDQDEAKRHECIKKNIHKSFSWNAHYHLKEAKEHRRLIEYHERMAKLCNENSKSETKKG